MSSIRQRINNKIKSKQQQQLNNTQKTQKIESFDETHLKIQVKSGQTQADKIQITCNWLQGNYPVKPQLAVKWFNKTESDIKQIQEVQRNFYQPSISDVGSIYFRIHIQAIPTLPGAQYQGMPIIKEVGPIVLDKQTEEETNQLLQAQKATFCIEIVGKQLYTHQLRATDFQNKPNLQKYQKSKYQNFEKIKERLLDEGLLKINKNQLLIFLKKKDKKQQNPIQQIVKTVIDQSYPIVTHSRINDKQVKIQIKLPQNNQQKTERILTIPLSFSDHRVKDVFLLLMKLIVGKCFIQQQTETVKEEQQDQQKISEVPTSTPKQSSQNGGSHNNLPILSNGKVEEMKSCDSLEVKSKQFKEVHIDSPTKKSAADLLSITQLKKKIKQIQQEKSNMQKAILIQRNEKLQANQKLSQTQQRLNSLNKNYFEIQTELNSYKNNESTDKVQISYYKNESRNLKAENQILLKNIKELNQNIKNRQQQLEKYMKANRHKTYDDLENQILQKDKQRQQLIRMLEFIKQEKQGITQKCTDLSKQLQDAVSQKNYIQRKYESLYYQKSMTTSPMMKSQISQISRDDSAKYSKNSEQQREQLESAREKQLLILKKQLKSLIQQNDYLRMMNLNQKDKKSSASKTQLKSQLLEMKKIINRLTETISQKDIAIQDLKKVNKDLNSKLVQLNRMHMQQVMANSRNSQFQQQSQKNYKQE